MSLDPLNAFKSEVFRPIASIMLPGALAIGMFALVLGNAVEEVRLFSIKQTFVYFAFFLGVATMVGMLLENVGSSIERGVDTCMDREYLRGADKVWSAYLAVNGGESNARKYLGCLVTRMKFIYSMIPATILFSLGLVSLNLQLGRWSWWWIGGIELLLLALVAWLFKSAIELSEAALFCRFKMLPVGNGIPFNQDVHTVSRFRHAAYALVELRTSRIEELSFVRFRGGALLWELGRILLPMTKKVREETKAIM